MTVRPAPALHTEDDDPAPTADPPAAHRAPVVVVGVGGSISAAVPARVARPVPVFALHLLRLTADAEFVRRLTYRLLGDHLRRQMRRRGLRSLRCIGRELDHLARGLALLLLHLGIVAHLEPVTTHRT